MIEADEIGQEQPNEERIQAIQHACQIFADISRFNPESAPAMKTTRQTSRMRL